MKLAKKKVLIDLENAHQVCHKFIKSSCTNNISLPYFVGIGESMLSAKRGVGEWQIRVHLWL